MYQHISSQKMCFWKSRFSESFRFLGLCKTATSFDNNELEPLIWKIELLEKLHEQRWVQLHFLMDKTLKKILLCKKTFKDAMMIWYVVLLKFIFCMITKADIAAGLSRSSCLQLKYFKLKRQILFFVRSNIVYSALCPWNYELFVIFLG